MKAKQLSNISVLFPNKPKIASDDQNINKNKWSREHSICNSIKSPQLFAELKKRDIIIRCDDTFQYFLYERKHDRSSNYFIMAHEWPCGMFPYFQ